MTFIISTSVLGFFGLGLALAVLYRQLAAPTHSLPVAAGWIDELSVERYRPMLRLLSEDDLQFLRSQPGFTSQWEARHRKQRCQVFRGYLSVLENDFKRVCLAIKFLMVHSQHDRPDLAATLIRSQLAFAGGMVMVQCRLVLYRWGLGAVDVADLIKLFDGMRLELRILVPVNLSALA